MSEFKDNASLSLGFAIKNYFKDMKEGGIAYLVYMVLIITTAILTIDGLITAIAYL